MITNTCKRCDKQFTRRKAPSDSYRYCSRTCSNKSRTGQASWNKGLKGYLAGSKHYNWGKSLDFMKAENNPNWKGGVSNDVLSKRRGTPYYVWRRHVFDKDDYTCQSCQQRGGYLHADHVKPWAKFPELRYDISNGRTLCQACHYFVTYKRKMPIGSNWGTKIAGKVG